MISTFFSYGVFHNLYIFIVSKQQQQLDYQK